MTKAEVSASIQQRDKESFEAWISNSSHKQRLDLPRGPLQFLITPRIFELADNPANLHQIVKHSKMNVLHFLVAETKEHPLTDINELRAFDARRLQWFDEPPPPYASSGTRNTRLFSSPIF